MTHRLLLVEDEEHLAFALEFNLKEEGFTVDVAFNIAQARSLLAQRYDVVLLDVMLPDGDGFELCRELRRRGDMTPVLFLTARGSSDDVVAGLQAGADDYMAKPFVLQELVGRISALLRRRDWDARDAQNGHKIEAGPPTRFGQNTIDEATRVVKTASAEVLLTDLEFRLLRYFLANAGRVVPREELLQKVWHVAAESNTRTVDIFLVRLRRLFEEDPARPKHFLTVRGVGYRFVVDP